MAEQSRLWQPLRPPRPRSSPGRLGKFRDAGIDGYRSYECSRCRRVFEVWADEAEERSARLRLTRPCPTCQPDETAGAEVRGG